MKYVVYWIFLKMIPLPQCEMGTYKINGKEVKMYCAVAHYKNEEIKDSAWYWSRESAYQRYLDMNSEREKSCVMVWTGSNSQQPMYLFPEYAEIRFDSIAPVAKLSERKVEK